MAVIYHTAHLVTYTPYWVYEDGDRYKNPDATPDTGKILDLKDATCRNYAGSVGHYTKILADFFHAQNFPLPGTAACLVVVPSSRAGHWCPGVTAIAKHVARMRPGLLNYSNALVRMETVAKKATGGDRDMSTDLRTIDAASVEYGKALGGKDIVLLDDVTTTGNSFAACSRILVQYGVRSVRPLAIGKTK